MMWYTYSGMGWWMVFSGVFWFVLLGVAVWALVRWVSHQTRTGQSLQSDQSTAGQSAEDILRQRFARGEIDSDTFERMRRQLATAASRVPAALPGGGQ
jgi:putative membrane protein